MNERRWHQSDVSLANVFAIGLSSFSRKVVNLLARQSYLIANIENICFMLRYHSSYTFTQSLSGGAF